MGLLIFIGIMWVIIDIIKEASEPTIPADHWNHAFDRDKFGSYQRLIWWLLL